MAGLQCLRRLWLLIHEPPPYEEPAPGSPLDFGREIGRKAHLLFPAGVEISEAPWEHAQAVARTAGLMADAGVPAAAAFLQLASGNLRDPGEVDRLRTALRLYCQRDTLALVELHRALIRLAETPHD